MTASDCDDFEAYWSELRPAQPLHAWLLVEFNRLAEAVHESCRIPHRQSEWEKFELERVAPQYATVAGVFNEWSVVHGLPTMPSEYSNRRETSQKIDDARVALLRALPDGGFDLKDAAAAACWFWSVRRLGVELLDGLFGDDFEWYGTTVPHFYPGIIHVPGSLWDFAAGSTSDIAPVGDILGPFARAYGSRSADLRWLREACAGAGDHPGIDPALPLALWRARDLDKMDHAANPFTDADVLADIDWLMEWKQTQWRIHGWPPHDHREVFLEDLSRAAEWDPVASAVLSRVVRRAERVIRPDCSIPDLRLEDIAEWFGRMLSPDNKGGDFHAQI